MTEKNSPADPKKSLKYRIGIFLIIFGFISPLFSLLVPLLGLPSGTTAAIVGLFMLGIPEVFLIFGAALAGKEAVNAVKDKIKAIFKSEGPPKPVSREQYNFGLLLIVLSIVGTWVLAYLEFVIDFEINRRTFLYLNFLGDALFIIGFFVLGEQFWEKFKRLFTWEPETQ